MTQRQQYASFADMPPGLRAFLFSEEFTSAEAELQKAYNLSDDAKVVVGDKTMDAIFNDIPLAQAVADIKAALVPSAFAEGKWKDFVTEYLKRELWALREVFGDELASLLAAQGVSTAGWSAHRVYFKPLTFSGAATEISTIAGFSLMGAPIRERMRDLVMSRVKGVRSDAQVRDVFVRPADFGGIGLDGAMADAALTALKGVLATARIISEDEYSDWLADAAHKKMESANPAVPEQAKTAEEEEIDRFKAAAQTPAVPPSVLEGVIQKTFDALAEKPTEEYLANRLRNIISSRLRDVRNGLEIVQLFQRDVKVGGLGMAQEAAERLGQEVETAYAASHDVIMAEEKGKIDKQLVEQKVKIEERKRKDAEEHAKWYQDKVVSKKHEEEQRQQMTEQMRQSLTPHPMDAKEAVVEARRFGEMMSAVQAGAVRIEAAGGQGVESGGNPPPGPSAGPRVREDDRGKATSGSVQAARSEVRVSKETIVRQPLASGLKQRIDDVRYEGPRLTGLTEELRSLTVSEFRRLGRTPELALAKIVQKLDALAQESFEKRIAGIKAYHESPLQTAYLTLVSEAFRSGTPVATLADQKRSAGQDALSPAEIAAIIDLNSKLHY